MSLDAAMVARGLCDLTPKAGSIVLIENVGNLVCPALFDPGERAKVVLFSVTGGEDKPLKYPDMFRAARVIVINKIDLLPHVDFRWKQRLRMCGQSIRTHRFCSYLSALGKACPLGMPGLRAKRPQPVNSPLSARRRDSTLMKSDK